MSKKRQLKILKKVTYARWNPFERPKDPIDIRTDKTKRTPHSLIREFLESKSRTGKKSNSTTYERGLLEMVIGLVNYDDRFLAMYEFCVWYNKLLNKENLEL